MDEIAGYNRERWEELSRAGVAYGKPWLELDESKARDYADSEIPLGDLEGKKVLLLAGGGGQQSAVFGLLGARVTVLDFCEHQLEMDRRAADHYGLDPVLLQGDMRDLSRFGDREFDIVWHAHSLAFIPDPRPVFREVARALAPQGLYHLHCTNPFAHVLLNGSWADRGYVPTQAYVDGAEVIGDPDWDVTDEDGRKRKVAGPREFLHALSTLANEPLALGFRLLGVWEGQDSADPEAEPGTWGHFCACFPPWLTFWWKLEKRGTLAGLRTLEMS
jgi:SAM-dependent methyltransferase